MKYIIIIIVVLCILYGIFSAVRYVFTEHPIISCTVVIALISLIARNFFVFIICEAIMLTIAACIILYIKIKEERIRCEREEQRRRDIAEIIRWRDEGENVEINIKEFLIGIVDEVKKNYHDYYDYNNMPYGRAEAFISNFTREDQSDNEYYFFKPKRTVNVFDIRENGILIAKSGIYIIYENKYSDDNIELKKFYLEYKDIYGYTVSERLNKLEKIFIINKHEDGFDYLYASDFRMGDTFDNIIKKIIESMLPQYIRYHGMCDELFYLDDYEDNQKTEKNNAENIINDRDTYEDINSAKQRIDENRNEETLKTVVELSGVIGGASSRTEIYNEVKNTMDGRQGHGYAAEYGNNTVDRLLGKDVINAGVGNAKDGADRIVNGELIQTKYCKDFNTTMANAFPDGKIRYMDNNGTPMKIEVPRDKYAEYCHRFQQKIDSGQIEGIEPGTRADLFLKKGHFSYEAVCNIAKAGTVEGLTVDMMNGVVTSVYPTTISSVITFAIAIWQGKTKEEAARAALEVGVSIMGRSVLIYTATMQLTRGEIAIPFLKQQSVNNPVKKLSTKMVTDIKNSKLANTYIGEKMGLKNISEQILVSNAVTAAVVFGPDIYSFFSGKISGKQLLKNSAVGVGSIAGATVAGAAFGPVGAIAGGVIAATATKKTLDKYIEDDAIEMFCIFKQEYLDIIITMQLYLSEKDIERVARETLQMESKQLSKMLKNMYASISPRQYAYDYILEKIQGIIANKEGIYVCDYDNGCQQYLIESCSIG